MDQTVTATPTPSAIAVIGMAGRFPGARDVESFWRNLRDGVESIHFFTEEALRDAGESPELLGDPSYVRACGRLDDIEAFDAAFFGMSPRDAAVFDPQHRLFLECAWHALEDSGYVGEDVPGAVGVFASSGASEYLMHNLLANREIMTTVGPWLVRHTGNDTNFLATRVSYELNLRGPSLSVQSACSSSLLAIHLACQSLLSGESDMALAGGSTVYPEQNRGYVYRRGEILSPDGHCRAFDARAAGTVMASAVGCVVLKRLQDALRDGDRVLAVVLGSAANNDGADKVGYLAPSLGGQARAIAEALAVSGLKADDVSYVEAHGTGTLIGDPIEVKALTEAFRATTDRTQFCAIGSVKTNIGHTGEAAGICGFIKTVLALTRGEIPASLHYREPNPQVDFSASPFFVNDRLAPWTVPPNKARIAGVTALGAGGTNVHVLLREPPASPVPEREREDGPQLLVVSARSKAALDHACSDLASHLRRCPEAPLADVAYTLLTGRKRFEFRRAVVAADALDGAEALESADPKRAIARQVTRAKNGSPPRVAFLFPGGGSQYPGMGAELYEKRPAYRAAIDACLGCMAPSLAAQVRSLLLARSAATPETAARLEPASVALPALFATEMALAKLLESWGIRPGSMIGHSAGEYAAACLAGVFSLQDAVSLVSLRGRLFDTMPEGAMLSVALPEDELSALLPAGVSVAAVNAPALCVASGPAREVAALEDALRQRAVDCTRVHLPIAAHSPMVDSILDEFGRFCRQIPFGAPRIPFVSNLTGAWITESEATDARYWVRHLRQTVRFDEGIQRLLEGGDQVLVEVGPGRTLSSFARQRAPGATASTTTLRHPQEQASDVAFLLAAVGRMWASGVAIDAPRLFERARRKVRLPPYPFERERHWVSPDPRAKASAPPGELERQTELGDWFSAPSWARTAPPATDGDERDATTWLVLSDGSRLAGRLVEGLRARATDRVVTVRPGGAFQTAGESEFALKPSNAADYELLARELRRRGLVPGRVVHLWSVAPRRRRLDVPRGRSRRVLRDYAHNLGLDFYSLLFLVRALGAELENARLDLVSSHMHALPGDVYVDPEKAMIAGARRVLAREYPRLAATSVDVAFPANQAEEDRVASLILRELQAEAGDADVALRGGDRWVRRFERVELREAPPGSWTRSGGVYVITGGLGGIGLEVAEHLARTAQAKLVLVGRRDLPRDEDAWLASHGPHDETSRRIERVRALRSMGSEVLVAAADVTDLEAMKRVVAGVHARFGRIHGVFHAAGQLRDELVAMRAPRAESPVLDTKAKGALVLDVVTRSDDPELFVLFSSVSSVLGLPGQAEYSAANAFLDAFAFARAAERPSRRTISIDWNAWKEVGMLASRVGEAPAPEGRCGETPPILHPLLHEIVEETPGQTLYRSRLGRDAAWPLSEHVVRGGDAVLPGTGMLELARAALAQPEKAGAPLERAVQFAEVAFLAPFVVQGAGERVLHVRLDRAPPHAFVVFGASEQETFVKGKIAYADAPAPAPAKEDLRALRLRCPSEGHVQEGRLVQHFMDFGPRWGCVESIRLGKGEAIVDLRLPDAFHDDLDVYRLHPALLDMATGGAQALVPGFEPEQDFYVPFSYGRMLLRRCLTATMTGHVRLRPSSGRDSPIFDVVLYDETGDELARVDAFMMRRAAQTMRMGAGTTRRAFGRGGEDAQRKALRLGMTNAEGLQALDRVLASYVCPQMVACTVDLDAWLLRLREESAMGNAADGHRASEAGAGARPDVTASFAAPRDGVERELAAIWRELLGLSVVGVHDDFFELGGQSLVAVRVFHRIGRKYGVELPLATLFEAPTIAHLAAILRARLGLPDTGEGESPATAAATGAPAQPPAPAKTKDGPSALVTIQPGRGRPPFFCVHGAGGNVLNFRDLARALDEAQPFYGLQARGVDGSTPPHETIEEMAEAYLTEVRALQPSGPYLLGGYSGGGLVAFEMARRLTSIGEDVGLLALIDTFHPETPIRALTTHARFTRLREEGLGYLSEALGRQRDGWRRRRDLRAIAGYKTRGEPIPFALRDLHMTVSFERAASRYRPAAWPGNAVLFRATRVAYIYRDAGPCYGWEKHVRGLLEVVRVEGDHSTVVLGANAVILAQSLQQGIARARAEPRVPSGRDMTFASLPYNAAS